METKTENTKIETMDDSLWDLTETIAKTYKRLVSETILSAEELVDYSKPTPPINRNWGERFYPANLALAKVEDGSLKYGISGRDTYNAIAGENIDDFCNELLQNGRYRLSAEQRKKVSKVSDVVWVDAAGLDLKVCDDKRSSFKVSTTDYKTTMTPAQRQYVKALWGSGEKFESYMETLSKRGNTHATFYVMNPEHAKKLASRNVIAHATWLNANAGVFDAYVTGEGVNNRGHDTSMRGSLYYTQENLNWMFAQTDAWMESARKISERNSYSTKQ